MKKYLIALAALTLSVGASAKLTNNTSYLIIPLTAGNNIEVKHFVTASADGTLTLSDAFSESAVWNWKYVSGTATTIGHYTLTNAATGQYLFTGNATTSTEDTAIKEAVSTANEAAHTLTADDKYLSVTSGGDVTVSTDASATTSAFLMMGYVATMTAGEIEEAAKNAVAVAFGIPDAVEQLLPMLQASYTGTRQAKRVLDVLYRSQTPADISTQLVEVRRTAVRMLESDLENGATWQQKSTGKYVDGIWYGMFTDNGNSKVENREFTLYNSKTKEYLVNTDGKISTSAEGGSLWSIAYFYGEGLAIAPAGSTDNSLLYPGSNGELTIGTERSNALIYIGEIAMFGEGVNSVKPVGIPGEEEGSYSAINAIELTVEHGATASSEGQLTLTFTSDDSTTTLETIAATEAKNPTTKTINVDYYDNTGTHQTGTREVDVYTLPLSESYTDGGEYMVRVNMGAFTLNGALSTEMAGYSVVNMSNLWLPMVTPAEGNLSSLTTITISGPDGVYVNPKAAPDASVNINCDGTNLEMFYPSDFAEGGAFDTYNPALPDSPWFTIPVQYTEPGRYSFYIPRSFFINNSSNPCDHFAVEWEVNEEGAIVNVECEKRNSGGETCDLLGRPAKKGLLISKEGKKFFR